MIDMHTHTSRCGHAEGTVPEYLQAALTLGVDYLAFTDHLPLPPSILSDDPRAGAYAMPERELDAYVSDVLQAQTRARQDGGPVVLLGIEADFIAGHEEFTKELLSRHPFDVVLGSVHMIDGWTFDDPDRIDGYSGWDIGSLWDRYFEEVGRAADSGLFDIMGHTDLVKKFCYYPDDGLDARYAGLADALAKTGVAIEVNTAGLRKPCAELYPSLSLLKALCRAGVPATIGSDAHTPAEVGFGYDLAVEALRSAGYRSVVVYEARVPREVAL